MPKTRKRTRVNVGTDSNGKTIYKWASSYTKKGLKAEVDRILAEHAAAPIAPELPATKQAQPPEPASAAPTFREYAAGWYELYKKPKIKPPTQTMYNSVFKVHLCPAFGDTRIDCISPDLLQHFILRYEDSSQSLIDKIAMTIKQVFNAAFEDELIPKNPARKMEPPIGTAGERMPLTVGDTVKLADAARKHEYGLFPLLFMYSGLRRGEAIALHWNNIDEQFIHVKRAATYGSSGVATIGDPKTDAGFRDVPILPELSEGLGRPKDGYVFHGRDKDEPMCYATFKRHWEKLRQDIPVMSDVTPHRLRHTYLMLMRRAGVDPATQQYIMGHADYETTANIYTHIDSADIEDARQKMTGLLPRLLPVLEESGN
jgi:integrase